MKSLFKPFARQIIGFLAKQTLLKHNPTVIAIVGDGPTSIMREVMYSALKEGIPTRRNLELPESEFSIPITILNYPHYPTWVGAWCWLFIKTALQLLKIRPYKHALVLEMHPLNQRAWDYWQQLIQPTAVIKIGEFSYVNRIESINLQSDASVDRMKEVATQLAERFDIEDLDIELGLETLTFPAGRIRFLRAKFDGIVIDSTYYYFPIRLESVLEVANAFEGRKVIFTSDKSDWENMDASWQVNPANYIPQRNDTVILRGKRTDGLDKYNYIAFVTDLK